MATAVRGGGRKSKCLALPANSASPHFVGAAASLSTKGKEPMEQVATDNELVVTFTSSDSEDESPKKKHWLFNRSSDEEEPQITAADIFGSAGLIT
jgi:hypothetical protein